MTITGFRSIEAKETPEITYYAYAATDNDLGA
jgi:hypothetical protein